jgi:PAS domain S-box-containing protein
VLVNAAAEALFGYRREELVGEQVEILVPERVREGHRRQRERFTAEGLTRRMGVGLELIACRKDGIEFPVEIGLSRVQADEGVLISAAICDISERRHAQAQIASLGAIVESWYGRRAGIPARLAHPHALRAYYATTLSVQGLVIQQIKEKLGHRVDRDHRAVSRETR